MQKNSCHYPENKYVVAVTGGIGSGKSFVCRVLANLGAAIIDADEIARRVVEPGSSVMKKIEKEWGKSVLNPDGSLNRQQMSSIIFSSEHERNKLDSIMHPEIRKVMYQDVEKCKESIVFLAIPLLFEARIPIKYDESWLVYCTPEQQKQRLMKREGISEEEALKRIRAQIDIDEKRKMADVIIDNTGEMERTAEIVRERWVKLRKAIGLKKGWAL